MHKADFNQNTSNTFDKTAGIDFSMSMGDGINANSGYDANGNIKAMLQSGLKINSSSLIDSLVYSYESNSNKLSQVIDGNNDNESKLGDFKYDPTTKGSTDYAYDANGNLTKDENKKITSISYNYLNLPSEISVSGKGTITYTYDAAGNKLRKITNDSTVASVKTTTTDYIGSFIYENNELQFFSHEEGRIRPVRNDDNNITDFVYDYFIKDHLGNVRMVLTNELQQNKYPVATLEVAKRSIELDYYAIDTLQIVSRSNATGIPDYINDNGIGNNPEDAAFSATNSAKLYKLNSNEAKTGLGITLKVMAGDKIDVLGKSYYFQNTSGTSGNSHLPILDLLGAFLSTPTAAIMSGHGGLTAPALNTPTGIAGITSMFTQQSSESNSSPIKPKAFINVIFFDEQFKATDFKISMVGAKNVIKDDDHYNDLKDLMADKNGYVYIYCSNESPVNVYFDNLQVIHTRGPILEETHYYPFGLSMNGISSKALNGIAENKHKFNGIEQNNDFDLNIYDAHFRNLDPQIGRFWQLDPKPSDSVSLYAAMFNNPIRYSDPLGDTVRVYVETKGVGHAWLSVGEEDKMVVYTFGRYAGTNGESSANSLDNGPGVLVRLEGADAAEYNQRKMDKTGATVFQINDIKDEKVASFMEAQFNSSNQLPGKGEYAGDSRAHVTGEYKLMGNNCTTNVSDAINNAGSRALETVDGKTEVEKQRYVMPAALGSKLSKQTNSWSGNGTVKKQEVRKPKK